MSDEIEAIFQLVHGNLVDAYNRCDQRFTGLKILQNDDDTKFRDWVERKVTDFKERMRLVLGLNKSLYKFDIFRKDIQDHTRILNELSHLLYSLYQECSAGDKKLPEDPASNPRMSDIRDQLQKISDHSQYVARRWCTLSRAMGNQEGKELLPQIGPAKRQ